MSVSSDTQQSIQSELRRHLVRASQMASQPWSTLGVVDELYPHAVASENIEVTAECVTSLLIVRLFVLATPTNKFKDFSTSTVCETLLGPRYLNPEIPNVITEQVVRELRSFVKVMLRGYNNVQYHNYKHAYHVVLSSCTLMDMIIQNFQASNMQQTDNGSSPLPFQRDGLMQFALIFSALIHDTEHQGVPNVQLVIENHPLALQYNDQSIAEQRSLTFGFLELLQPCYDNLREVIFPQPSSGETYRRFRGAVTSMILATDIATPARGKEVRERWDSIFKTSTDKKNLSSKNLMGGVPVLSPPREHPTPNRRRRKTLIARKINTSEEESWIDCAPTPSTHFPRSLTGTSMHDSLSFWWFSPDQLTEDNESVKTFSEDDTTAASLSNHDLTTLPDPSEGDDLDASISVFSEFDKSFLGDESALADEYPHESKAFQFSCSTLNGNSDHHLLSKSRITRSGSKFSRSPSDTSKACKQSDVLPGYCDLSISGNSSIGSKPRTIVGAFAACTPKRKARKANIVADQFEETRERDFFASAGSSSSFLSTSLTADLTSTDTASADFPSRTEDGFDSFRSFDFPDIIESEDHSSNFEEEEELLEISDERMSTEQLDEHQRSLSLMEHILLVADVSHTMQCWDTMNTFAHRLSKEIMKSIKKGRSGGIKEDPLSDWYSNQSAFLHAYILPLAQRLEQTGTLPQAEDGTSGGFLTSQIQKNLERWQDQGHDIIAAWRREREERKSKKVSKKLKKKKHSKEDSSRSKKEHCSKGGKNNSGEAPCTSSDGEKKRSNKKGKRIDGVPVSSATNTAPCCKSLDNLDRKIQLHR